MRSNTRWKATLPRARYTDLDRIQICILLKVYVISMMRALAAKTASLYTSSSNRYCQMTQLIISYERLRVSHLLQLWLNWLRFNLFQDLLQWNIASHSNQSDVCYGEASLQYSSMYKISSYFVWCWIENQSDLSLSATQNFLSWLHLRDEKTLSDWNTFYISFYIVSAMIYVSWMK